MDKKAKRKQRVKQKAMHAVRLRSNPFIFKYSDDADPDFVTLIKTTLKQISFCDPLLFNEEERRFLSIHLKSGWNQAAVELKVNEGYDKDKGFTRKQIDYLSIIGRVLFKLINREVLKQFVPFNDVEILPFRNKFIVKFRSLRTVNGTGQTYYYSNVNPPPKVCINGLQGIVAFSNHAIVRACERTSRDVCDYLALGDTFARFNQCIYFEPCLLHGKDGNIPAFSFYDECPKGFFAYNYVEQILGPSKKGKKYYFRIGYCPVVHDGTYWLAKTMLFPGYRTTPERDVIEKSQLSESEKTAIVGRLKNLTLHELWESKNLDDIKLMHNSGVKQVCDFEHDLYSSII